MSELLRPYLQPYMRGIADKGAGGLLVPPPVGFDWVPPVKVFRNPDGTYSTDFDADDWRIPATVEIWVSLTGNNTTGDGTQALPYKSLLKALTVAQANASNNITIYVTSGVYDRNGCGGNTHNLASSKSVNIIAVGGRVKFSLKYEPLTWTLHSTGVYVASRTAIVAVFDESNKTPVTDDFSINQKLTLAATLADCESTSGTYFIASPLVYVHAFDGRTPDSQLLLIANLSNLYLPNGPSLYVENIDFEGGGSPGSTFQLGNDNAAQGQVVFNNCSFTYGAANGMAATGSQLVILNNCYANGNGQDGFNYHGASVTGVSSNSVEINCTAIANGYWNSTTNNNSTSIHENGRIVRVNGEYSVSRAPVVADVTTTMSWNVNCTAGASLLTGQLGAAWLTSDSAHMWLDNCTSYDSPYATYAADSSSIRTRGGSLVGPSFGDVAGY